MEKVIKKLKEMESICNKYEYCADCPLKKLCDKYCGEDCPNEMIERLGENENVENIEDLEFVDIGKEITTNNYKSNSLLLKKYDDMKAKEIEQNKYFKETFNKVRHYYNGDDLDCGVREYNAIGYKVKNIVINKYDLYTVVYERF